MSSFGFNTGYVEEMYKAYLDNPGAVSESWREFFADFNPNPSFVGGQAQNQPAQAKNVVVETPPAEKKPASNGKKAAKVAPLLAGEEAKPMRGASARIVDNMEASLGMPTATSVRQVPVKLMAENRRLINDFQKSSGGNKVSFTHILAFAIVKAIGKFPNMNSGFRKVDGKPEHIIRENVNLGLAIDVQKKNGTRSLMVPNIKAAQTLNFAQFLGMYNDLVKRSRINKIGVEDFVGTSVTLTNPGMIGTAMSVPRLMPGQGLIIAAGAIGYPEEYLALPPKEIGRLGISQVMGLTSTYDHRVIQGAESGAFLSHLSKLIMGEAGFYEGIMSDLGIPTPPYKMALDSTSFIGARDQSTKKELISKQARVLQLIRAYRVRGHLLADVNPLGYKEEAYHQELDPASYGLTIWDLDRVWFTNRLAGEDEHSLREIMDILWATYSRKVGTEYMHITDPKEKIWLQERIEPILMAEKVTQETKRHMLQKLNSAEAFERFLHTKYVGNKRFSLEGAESLITILDRILSDAADQEVKEAVIGMAHRGRLNVLANTLGKSLTAIFSEFEGISDLKAAQGSGDVKYHLGAKGVHTSQNNNTIDLLLAPNPSHLEAVNPVVEGMTRARQELLGDESRDSVLPILIHGDAAFAGQGVVAETLNLSGLKGYTTGGTVHIVVNNQIGFTTSPIQARTSTYATDIARMIQAPIFHVNGDDPEACVRVARLALDYRQVFNKDVVIDMLCYRKHGHNEGDEPTYTQPIMYKKIKNKRSVRKLYTESLLRRGDLNPEEAEHILDDFQAQLNTAFEDTKELDAQKPEVPVDGALEHSDDLLTVTETYAGRDKIDAIVNRLVDLPESAGVHPKLKRQFDKRKKQFFELDKVDWALAEALAYGTLLLDGTAVRLSGQDCGRGTFSHRHAVIHHQETNALYLPLNDISPNQAKFQVFDSHLSEFAVLGFEFGYTLADRDALVIWEAQFGDFANTAQVMIDQFIAASEEKWGETSRLVMLLPHGYEGQGPEHSSARLERYLQLCAEENMQVCNFTTPANFFHALRRQTRNVQAKPLIVMSPKSLLRHPKVVSHPDELTDGAFKPVIEPQESVEKAKRVLFCSGKIYYELTQALEDHPNKDDVAIARVEQLYPFPYIEAQKVIQQHEGAEIVWVQEEPRNMGAWSFVHQYFEELLEETFGEGCKRVKYAGRPASASTATGSGYKHAESQKNLVNDALTVKS